MKKVATAVPVSAARARSVRSRILAAGSGVVLTGALVAGPAHAASATPTDAGILEGTPALSEDAASSAAESSESSEGAHATRGAPDSRSVLASYWSADRRADARPRTPDVPEWNDSAGPKSGEPASSTAPAAGGGNGGPGGPGNGKGKGDGAVATDPLETKSEPVGPTVVDADDPEPSAELSPVAGKVSFTDPADGLDYTCSGSAVNSESKSLVVTAAHCVHGGPAGGFYENLVFMPACGAGMSPEGVFAAESMFTFADWAEHGAVGARFDSDVAFVRTSPNEEGTEVVDEVGGHGLTVGGAHMTEATLYAYPGNIENGELQQECTGAVDEYALEGYTFNRITGCDFGGGSSGGSWLEDYSVDEGLGTVRTVTSFGPANNNRYIAGAYFGTRVGALYDAADAAL